MELVPTTDWNSLLRREFDRPYWAELQDFVRHERERHVLFAPLYEVFAALHLTSFAATRVVILGQDPYHGSGQAHGLCFSVRRGVPIPPSLRNMHKELQQDLGCPTPSHGNLEHWARQGVLLLNTTLTVREGEAASHQGRGWETFTDEVISAVDAKSSRVVFLLWGAASRKKKSLIDTDRHTVIESAHPSPLSAHNGFLGSRPFSRANQALRESGQEPIDWAIPD
jgi:uracil-DNA glycosylase